MKIEKALLIDFSNPNIQTEYEVVVPQNSKRLDLVSLNQGIMIMYLVPDQIVDETKEVWAFKLLLPNESIDMEEYEFCQTISIFTPQTDGNGNDIPGVETTVLLFPIFIKKD